jgi:hypothetical protein
MISPGRFSSPFLKGNIWPQAFQGDAQNPKKNGTCTNPWRSRGNINRTCSSREMVIIWTQGFLLFLVWSPNPERSGESSWKSSTLLLFRLKNMEFTRNKLQQVQWGYWWYSLVV